MKRPTSFCIVLFVTACITAGLVSQAAAGAQSGGQNPRANFWRGVRDGQIGTTTSGSEGHNVLIQNGGQNWREIRNGPIAGIAPYVIAAVLAAIALFYLIVGPDRLEEPRSGELLDRFSLFERILHWFTAVLFIALALTGLSILFGRAVLIPLFGHTIFSAYMQPAILVHNFCGPVFLAAILIEAIAWTAENIPKKLDLLWFKNLGGMTHKGPRPHAEKINGGEKGWFWFMLVAGTVMGCTGLILDSSTFGQTRLTLQIAHVIHVTTAIFFIAGSFGHIYVGTIGAEGTFEGMWRGTVDKVWARQHSDLWYQEKTGKSDRSS